MFGEFFGPARADDSVDDSGWGAPVNDDEPAVPGDGDSVDLVLQLHLPAVGATCSDPLSSSEASVPDAMSLVISHALASGEQHTHVPSRVLSGLLPEALLQQYQFWQVSPTRLTGERVASDHAGESTVTVDIVNDPAVPGRSAVVTRPVPAEQVVGTSSARSVWQLLDIVHAPGGSLLHRLATVMARIENVSHTLVWGLVGSTTARSPQGFPLCEVALVDLPRLKVGWFGAAL